MILARRAAVLALAMLLAVAGVEAAAWFGTPGVADASDCWQGSQARCLVDMRRAYLRDDETA